jgi:hypothetical protein
MLRNLRLTSIRWMLRPVRNIPRPVCATAPQGLAEYLREVPHGGPQFIKDNLKDPFLTPPSCRPGSMKGVIRNMTSVAFALFKGATWLPGRQPPLTGLQVTTSSTT